MNPMALLTLKSSFEKFQKNHPRFIQFAQAIMQTGVKEGTIFECKVITPDGKELQTNIKITQDDLEMIEKLKEMSKNA